MLTATVLAVAGLAVGAQSAQLAAPPTAAASASWAGASFCTGYPNTTASSASFRGITACTGPNYRGEIRHNGNLIQSRVPGFTSWQCTEYAARYFYAMTGKPAPLAPTGAQTATKFSSSKYKLHGGSYAKGGTKKFNASLVPGAIISMWGSSGTDRSIGHVAVVTKVNVTRGKGTIQTIEENYGNGQGHFGKITVSGGKMTAASPSSAKGYKNFNWITGGGLTALKSLTTATPTIEGMPVVGYSLNAKPGKWTSGTEFTYQWKRGGVAIGKASKTPTYKVTAADVGKPISVTVNGSKYGYKTASKGSAATTAAIPWAQHAGRNGSVRTDFDGDGKSDVFYVTLGSDSSGRNDWWVTYGGIEGAGRVVNKQANDSSRMFIGDFNGDGKSDVFYVTHGTDSDGRYARWVSYGGVADGAEILGYSPADPSRMFVGDFDGDGKSDIFYVTHGADSSGRNDWWISYGGEESSARVLNKQANDPSRMFIGDFNGDGKSDVFYVTVGADSKGNYTWWVSYGGLAAGAEILRTSPADPSRMFVGDFDGDGKSDIFYVEPKADSAGRNAWAVSYGGKSAWRTLNRQANDPSRMFLGDFDGDGRSDVFYVSRAGDWWVTYGGAEGSARKLNHAPNDPSRMFVS